MPDETDTLTLTQRALVDGYCLGATGMIAKSIGSEVLNSKYSSLVSSIVDSHDLDGVVFFKEVSLGMIALTMALMPPGEEMSDETIESLLKEFNRRFMDLKRRDS